MPGTSDEGHKPRSLLGCWQSQRVPNTSGTATTCNLWGQGTATARKEPRGDTAGRSSPHFQNLHTLTCLFWAGKTKSWSQRSMFKERKFPRQTRLAHSILGLLRKVVLHTETHRLACRRPTISLGKRVCLCLTARWNQGDSSLWEAAKACN